MLTYEDKKDISDRVVRELESKRFQRNLKYFAVFVGVLCAIGMFAAFYLWGVENGAKRVAEGFECKKVDM